MDGLVAVKRAHLQQRWREEIELAVDAIKFKAHRLGVSPKFWEQQGFPYGLDRRFDRGLSFLGSRGSGGVGNTGACTSMHIDRALCCPGTTVCRDSVDSLVGWYRPRHPRSFKESAAVGRFTEMTILALITASKCVGHSDASGGGLCTRPNGGDSRHRRRDRDQMDRWIRHLWYKAGAIRAKRCEGPTVTRD
jgi:hypothetical protein